MLQRLLCEFLLVFPNGIEKFAKTLGTIGSLIGDASVLEKVGILYPEDRNSVCVKWHSRDLHKGSSQSLTHEVQCFRVIGDLHE